MGIRYTIRIKDDSAQGYRDINVNSWWYFMKTRIMNFGRVYYYIVRPNIKED